MELIWFLWGFALALVVLCGFLTWLYSHIKHDLKSQGLELRRFPWRSLLSIAFTETFTEAVTGAITEQQHPLSTTKSERPHQLTQSESHNWQHILRNAPVGYLEVDEENYLYWGNDRAFSLLGIQDRHDDTSTKRLLLQLVRSYELDLLIAETRTAQRSLQKKWVFHQVIPDPLHPTQQQGHMLKGYSIPLENEHIGIFIEDGQEAAILQQQRDRWASDVAHELKTPLTSIRLIGETLYSRVTPELREWMERLIQEVIRLSDVVEDLLDLGQMDTGMSLQLNFQSVDLPKLVQSAWKSLEPLSIKRQVSLEYCGPSSLLIQADKSRIYRLLLNLFDNSIKHSPQSQAVLVKIDAENDMQGIPQAIIEVIDRGNGFPEEALPHVFERFYRVDRSRTRSSADGGSGLGLAIAHQIVQAHQGTITVSNHPETRGAWVRITLRL